LFQEKLMLEEKKKILLADDNLVNQKLVTLLLQQLGLEIQVVGNGRQAVQAAQESSYAVILMDCQMPEMDGFEATIAIRKLETLSDTYTPIIAVTALAMVGDRERCISVGMDDYISKPIDRQVLKIKLNHWLQKEFVLRNHELARRYSHVLASGQETAPINLVELREFYAHDLEDVLKTFVATTECHIEEIKKVIGARDAELLAHLAHELKGSSAAVGAKQVAKLALFLERAAGLRDWREAAEEFAQLIIAFESVRAFLTEGQQSLSGEVVTLPTVD
jgi:CheY-like chemotaxis protein/HPt (histidine-containing phosphotransfer) domain-containing protein